MKRVNVVAVVGACGPERNLYASRLATASQRTLIPASRLAAAAEPSLAAAALAPWSDQPGGAVVEFPSTVNPTEVIGALTDPDASTTLSEIVCVVDAAHLFDDLAVDDFLVSERDAFGAPTDYVARAALTATQIEYASMIMLVGWEAVPTPLLSTIMALVSALAPTARLRLARHGVEAPTAEASSYDSPQDRAGWMRILNGAADPHMTDPRVSMIRYEQLRPFHPERLSALLMQRFDAGEFGQIVRSAGFCRFASRPGTLLQWDHVGHTIAFHLVSEQVDRDTGFSVVGEDLAFIGLDLERSALTTALDQATLTDEELTAGPRVWSAYPDPFPSDLPAEGSARREPGQE